MNNINKWYNDYIKNANLEKIQWIKFNSNELDTFLENNLYVWKIFNKKTNKYIGTIASKNKLKIKYPLTNYELGLCATKAGIPYHDPNLAFSNKEILELREYEYRHSNLMSSSKYMKIRSMRGEDE